MRRKFCCIEMSFVVTNGWKFDLPRLKSELKRVLEEHNIHKNREGGLHGVSVTSSDGTSVSGFGYHIEIQYDRKNQNYREWNYNGEKIMLPDVVFDLNWCRENKVYHMLDFNKPTSACTGYFKEIVDMLTSKNMNPRRCRLSYLGPGEMIKEHSDGRGFKFHIPIHTDGTDFVYNDKSYKLEEGTAYMCNVHPRHYVANNNDTDRWHFVCDVWDTDGNFSIGKIEQSELFQETINAMYWRGYVNGLRDYPDRILIGSDPYHVVGGA